MFSDRYPYIEYTAPKSRSARQFQTYKLHKLLLLAQTDDSKYNRIAAIAEILKQPGVSKDIRSATQALVSLNCARNLTREKHLALQPIRSVCEAAGVKLLGSSGDGIVTELNTAGFWTLTYSRILANGEHKGRVQRFNYLAMGDWKAAIEFIKDGRCGFEE